MAGLRVILAAVLHALLWQTTLTYPNGAPTGRCESMTPGHGSESIADTPYSLDIGAATMYRPGNPIQVTVRGGNFQGILLQVRAANEQTYAPIGRFDAPQSGTALRLLNCNNVVGSAITHSVNNEKFESVLTWNPPATDVGEIEFVATVNEVRFTWWKNVKSSSLTFDPTTTSTVSPPPSTSIGPTTSGGSTTRGATPGRATPPPSSSSPPPDATTVGGATTSYAAGFASMLLCGMLWMLLKN